MTCTNSLVFHGGLFMCYFIVLITDFIDSSYITVLDLDIDLIVN